VPRRRGPDTAHTDDLVVIELDDEAGPPAAPDLTAAPSTPARRHVATARTRRTRIGIGLLALAVLAGATVATVTAWPGRRSADANDVPGVTHRRGRPGLPFATGSALVVADGAVLRRVDLDTGAETAARFPRFASGALQLELATRDALVVRTASQPATGAWTRFVVPADLLGAPVGVATETETLAAAADGHHVLLVHGPGRGIDELDARGHARHVTDGGGFLAFTVVGTHAGVVVGAPGSWRVFHPRDPTTPRAPSRSGSLLAVGDLSAVWAASACGPGSCPLRLTDLASGVDRPLPDAEIAAFLSSYDARDLDLGVVGRVSPDGRRLALLDAHDDLAVADLATGDLVDTRTTVLGLGSVAWSPDGATLFALAADEDRGSVVVLRPDTGDAHLLPLGLQTAVSLAVVPGPRRSPARSHVAAPATTSGPSGRSSAGTAVFAS
jgi:hypothetical protein